MRRFVSGNVSLQAAHGYKMPPCLIGLGSRFFQETGSERSTRPCGDWHSIRRCGCSRKAVGWRRCRWAARPINRHISTAQGIVETSLQPEAMLELLQQIETALGRRHDERWGPRTKTSICCYTIGSFCKRRRC